MFLGNASEHAKFLSFPEGRQALASETLFSGLSRPFCGGFFDAMIAAGIKTRA